MPHHEIKECPRCKAAFECKAGDIIHCQCFGIVPLPHLQELLADKYTDCLCRKCLDELNVLPADSNTVI